MEFERRVQFMPAYDRRDPDPKKNYGVHGVDISFALIGSSGAVTLTLFTPWFLDSVDVTVWPKSIIGFIPADVGLHSRERLTPYQTQLGSCHLFEEGQKCWYDGSGLTASKYFRILREKGTEGLWPALEEYYYRRFPLDGSILIEDGDVLVAPELTFNEKMALVLGITPEEAQQTTDDLESSLPDLERYKEEG